MNWLGLCPIIIGLIYLMYSILSRNKVIWYYRSERMIVIKEKSFFKLQLYFSIANSIYMIALGVIIIIYNLENVYVVGSPIPFHFLNYLFKIVSKMTAYAKYE
ncbi:hypothetical protein [Clostridium ganghwense]|uniref:DUF3784 domain-containing protein n=1 Tax=Clostridium ganghwense TaxID=312089 RepID=A0ABT4CX50_9CLOT|nr:hypothetical protein [Clostridium ganghwense]MCY6372601.1 hypothetical protein [Clostridium ganghwense]